MSIDVKVLALANLVIQLILVVVLSVAVYFSVKKRNFKKHCAILRLAVPLQILVTVTVMLPSLLGYIENEHKGLLFNTEILVHHSLGLVAIVVWIYINLVFLRVIKPWGRLKVAMRLALASWVAALLIGLHLYVSIWILKI